MTSRILTLQLNADQAAALDELQVATGERTPAKAILAAIRTDARTRRQSAERLALVERQAEELCRVNERLEGTLAELRRAQDQIVKREKLAALGQLTAGVAHEIRNPLNFIKNFAEGCVDLLAEMEQEPTPTPVGAAAPSGDGQRRDMAGVSADIGENIERILFHAGRADRIVRDMLALGRGGGERCLTPINDLVDAHARLARHGARAAQADFAIETVTDYGEDVGELEVVPQDLGRVFLHLVDNACDALDDKRRSGAGDVWRPTLTLTTRRLKHAVEVRVRDNGNGLPADIVDKVFDPFFTTKPADQGTGLGLALSADIVGSHGGSIRVETEAGEYAEMVVELPILPRPP